MDDIDDIDTTESLASRVAKLDSVVSTVVESFVKRAEIGKAKYGTDMDRDDLKFSEWIQHAIEESMDKIVYLQKMKQFAEKLENSSNCCEEV
jgi:DNA relaxase NicK